MSSERDENRLAGRNPALCASGFTLLEVMVALTIVALALFAIMEVQLTARRQWGYAREMSTAALLARAKMAELELILFDDLQPDSGEFEDYPIYSFEVQLNPFMNVERTHEVTVTIQGPNRRFKLVAVISDVQSTDPEMLGITSQGTSGFPTGVEGAGRGTSQQGNMGP